MKIALCTQGSLGIIIIRKLFELGFLPKDILVFSHDIQSSANQSFIEFLNYFDIFFMEVGHNMIKLSEKINNGKVKLLISASYKYIFKEPIFKIKELNMINLHPGILPNYRGWFSLPWSIFNGEEYSGYTFHLIDADIDTGNIIYQEKIPILKTSTAFDLHFKMMNKAIEKLEYIIDGNWLSMPQKKGGIYYRKTLPNNGYIDTTWDLNKIDRFIRALFFPPYKGALLKTEKGDIEIFNIDQYKRELYGK